MRLVLIDSSLVGINPPRIVKVPNKISASKAVYETYFEPYGIGHDEYLENVDLTNLGKLSEVPTVKRKAP